MALEIRQGGGFADKARDTAFCSLREMILAVHDRQNHEWHLGVVFADPLKKIEAGHVWHHPIADDKVNFISGFAKLLPGYLPIGSGKFFLEMPNACKANLTIEQISASSSAISTFSSERFFGITAA